MFLIFLINNNYLNYFNNISTTVVPKCDGGRTYHVCNSKCAKTCQDMNKMTRCMLPKCLPGCFCPVGTVLNGNQCVPVADCPCLHNKVVYKTGQSIQKDCNKW